MPPLPSSSLLFANALGPVCSRRSHASLQPLPPPCCRRSAGESSSSSPSSSSSSSISASRRRSRPIVDAKASSTPPPPPNNARSFDGEDELDSVVSAELAQYIDPERAKQEQKRLELAWAVRAKVISMGFVEATRQFEGRFFFSFFSNPLSNLSLPTPHAHALRTPIEKDPLVSVRLLLRLRDLRLRVLSWQRRSHGRLREVLLARGRLQRMPCLQRARERPLRRL